MKIEFNSNYGQFDYNMAVEITEEVGEPALSLIKEGLANIAYRVCGSAADKKMGVVGEKGVKLCKRGEVEYTDEKAMVLKESVAAKLKELAKDSPFYAGVEFTVTGKHEAAEGNGGETKEARTLWETVQALPEVQFEKALAKLGLDVDYTDEQGIAACRRTLLEAKRAAAKNAANALGI